MRALTTFKRKLDNHIFDVSAKIRKYRYKLPYLPSWLEWLRKEEQYGSAWIAIFIIWIIIGWYFQISFWPHIAGFIVLVYLNLIDSYTTVLCFKKPPRPKK